ncbi:MAG: molybdenum cofactor guanylyltransferase [Thaumarchaeota archaeon]|nr:molybdenum cofactor guanylyltransferase [Nitrososphaerota archaeon]
MIGKRAAIILAGGRSSRMGENKALMMLNGKTMLEHIVEAIRKITGEIVLVIGFDQDMDAKALISKNIPIIKDILDVKSPLIGILTGTKFLSAEYVSVHPCDTPLIEPSLMGYLFKRAEGHEAAIAITKDGRLQPLNSVYKSSAVHRACDESLNRGETKCKQMIQHLEDVVYVKEDELTRFDPLLRTYININTRQEFQELRLLLGKA